MGTVAVQLLEDNRAQGYKIYLWETLNATNTAGDPVDWGGFADRSVQVVGTFGTGGTVVIQGSNMATVETPTYATMEDIDGTDLSFTTADLLSVGPVSGFVRPLVTTAATNTDIDVYLMVRK